MRLYGLYKQAMEGDVDGVMERPTAATMAGSSEDLAREQDKWDAWNSQKGLNRTEAKRRYVEALVETMHKYANTPNALELVSELEFVWNQVKSNSSGSSEWSSGISGDPAMQAEKRSAQRNLGGTRGVITSVIRRFASPTSGTDGPMKILSPMSEPDESEQRLGELADQGDDESSPENARRNDKRSKRMERAIVRLSAEIAALREQIATGREWKTRKERGFTAWATWAFWGIAKHVSIDLFILVLLLIWMRKRKDKRFEDHVRGLFRLGREYVRKILPSR
jgi:acyl-CoA-binding protein